MENNSFKLFHLPFLAYEHILKFMTIQKIVSLSVASQKVSRILKLMNIKVKKLDIDWSWPSVITIIRSQTDCCYLELRDIRYRSYSSIHRDHIENTIAHVSEHCLKDCLQYSDHLEDVFKIEKIVDDFDVPELKSKTVKKYLSSVLKRNHSNITIYDPANFDPVLFEYLMENADFNTNLKMDFDIPSNVRHENMLKFKSFEYSDAGWMTVDDLKSIRNCDSVVLRDLNFTSEDLNNFLKFWVNCEFDMMKSLKISFFNAFSMNILLSGIVNIERDGRFYIMAKRKPGRQFLVASVRFEKSEIEFTTYLPEGRYEKKTSMLELIEKKLDVENRKSQLEREIRDAGSSEFDSLGFHGG